MSCAKSNSLRTIKQIKGVQDWHNLLCACCAGREVFELEGSEESCLDSTILKITSHMAKRNHALVHLIMYEHALAVRGHNLSWTID